MGTGSDLYGVVKILHLVAVIAGVGTVFLNGVYGAQIKKRQGPDGLAIAEANLHVSEIAEKIIYAIPVFGVLLLLLSDGAWKWGQFWIWGSLVLFAIAMGISHGVLFPNVKRMNALMGELVAMGPPPAGAPAGGPPPQVAELEQRGKTVGMAGAALDLIIVVFLWLMIFKPGV